MIRKKRVVLLCFGILCVFALVLAGYGVFQDFAYQVPDDELQPVSSTIMTEDEAAAIADKVPLKLYYAEGEGAKLGAEIRYIPASESKEDIYSVIIRELLKDPVSDTLKRVIPEGTSLLNNVIVEKGTASVDLSKDFVDKIANDANTQNLAVYSIVNTLTELKEIDRVKILVQGKSLASLGQVRIDGQLARNTALIGRTVPISNVH